MTNAEAQELTAKLEAAIAPGMIPYPSSPSIEARNLFKVIRACTYRQELGEQRRTKKSRAAIDVILRENVKAACRVLRR